MLDCRLLPTQTTHEQQLWLEGQLDFERWNSDVWLSEDLNAYLAERDALKPVYADFDFSNKRIIDVGGSCGLLRHFLPSGAPYVVIDPHRDVLAQVRNMPNLLAAYPFLREQLNFICGDAEFLPIQTATFDVVHMRSCIDHFLNPELALFEGHRVLTAGGTLIVGISVVAATHRASLRERVRGFAVKLAGKAEHDHHTWHPTPQTIEALITGAGFRIDKRVFQDGFDNRVVYLFCTKIEDTSNPRTA